MRNLVIKMTYISNQSDNWLIPISFFFLFFWLGTLLYLVDGLMPCLILAANTPTEIDRSGAFAATLARQKPAMYTRIRAIEQ